MIAPRLVVITPPDSIPRETHTANALLKAGLQRLHLRKPSWDVLQLQQYVAEIDPVFHGRISVHTWQGAVALKQALPSSVQGIHHIARARPPAPLPSLSAVQSASFHTLEEIATDWGPALNYAFLSPVFDSISKAGYTAATFEPHTLKALLRRPETVPILALGGVTARNIPECSDMGFQGVAALGTVWGAAEPLCVFTELQDACDRTWGVSCVAADTTTL